MPPNPDAASPGSAADQVDDRVQVAQFGADGKRGEDGLPPARELVGDLGPRADQRDVLDHAGRDGRDGRLLVAGQVVVLDGGGLRLVAHPGEDLVVVVDAAGAHAADIEGEDGPQLVGRPLDVVVDDDAHRAADDVEAGAGVPGAGAGKALGQRGRVEVVHGGREEHGEPPVGDLGG